LSIDRPAFKGRLPEVEDLEAVDNFDFVHDRKLYINSCTHAITAYMGYAFGYELINKAILDRQIEPVVRGAAVVCARSIETKYNLTRGHLAPHVDTFMARMANPNLLDPVLRVGRDPIRKLGPHERLIGACRLVTEQRFDCADIALGAAYALRFGAESDTEAVRLQEMIATNGVVEVLATISKLALAGPIARKIIERFEELSSTS
jgi:mannitol-1-phosphate 5-dehydrogenase